MKYRKALLFTFFIVLFCTAAANDSKGLLFLSKEVGPDNRTGLDITKKGKIKYDGSFTISFDLSFRFLAERYGTIFQLKETEGENQLDLICKIDAVFPDLFILQNKSETNLKLGLAPIHNEMTNRWYSFKLSVDTKSGRIEMEFDNKMVSDTIHLPKESSLEWTFGVVNNYGFETDEVPPMSIRNIKFEVGNQLEYFWPLDKSAGQWTKDSVKGKKAQLIHPSWNVEQHQRWKKIKDIEFNAFPQIAFDKEAESIVFLVRNEGVYKYKLNDDNLIHYTEITGKPFYEDGQQVAFNKDNKLVAYSFYDDRISTFDEAKQRWDNEYDTIPPLPEYWHHNKIVHPVDSVLTVICGYGFFQYFNLFQQFDDRNNVWKSLKMSGDEIYPRYLSALGQSDTKNHSYYLFGGLGNKKGKQIFGKEFYYDLYRIDCDSNYITRLWESDKVPELDFTPVNSMVVDDREGVFYTLCFPHNKFSTYLQVLKGKISSPEWVFLADSIPYNFKDIESFADLYYWETHHELVALTCNEKEKGKFEVTMYALNFPPELLEAELSGNWYSTISFFNYKLIAAFMVLLVLVLIFILLKVRRKLKTSGNVNMPNEAVASSSVGLDSAQITDKGKILMFGGFQVFDKNNNDITYRFSPTLKELFLLLLLHTIDANRGISSKKIQEYLWPDKSAVSAKNNRGVNIKKLRLILEDVGDVSITYDGNYWRINHGDEVFCDAEFIKQQILNGSKVFSVDELNKILTILARGNFLVNIESDWLDKIKDDVTGRILSWLEEFCASKNQKVNENLLLQVADVLFAFDQMNETALEYKCRILNKQGKHSLALEVYNHYTKLYQNLYKEEFKTSFKSLVK